MPRFEVFWEGITSHFVVNTSTPLPDTPLDKVYEILIYIRDADSPRRGDYFQINEDGSWGGQALGRRFRITQKEATEVVGQAGVGHHQQNQNVQAGRIQWALPQPILEPILGPLQPFPGHFFPGNLEEI